MNPRFRGDDNGEVGGDDSGEVLFTMK